MANSASTRKGSREGILSLVGQCVVIVLLAGAAGAAQATTVAVFDWVPVNPATGTGTLTLSLPDSVTTSTFSIGYDDPSAAGSAVTGFSYTFSNGLSVGLANLTSRSVASNIWSTSNTIDPGFGAPTGVYLTSNFQLAGQEVFAGDPRAALFNIASAGGLIDGPLGFASNQMTPFTASASNDAGYWRLESFTPVPLPAAVWLLGSGLLGLGAAIRRRGSTSR